MTPTAEKSATKLSDYEQAQIKKIASWKATHPNPFAELFHRVTRPVAKLVEWIIPDRLALEAIEAVYKTSELAATRNDIKLLAGVADLSELRHRPMQVCDDLSRRSGTMAQGVAVLEGALTGAGGVLTTLLDVPLLYTVCLTTIIKTGHCYGYPLDQPTDKAWVLGALAVALSDSRQRRTDLMIQLREIEDILLEDIQENLVIEETASLLTQIEIFEDVPLFGAAGGALLNLWVAHRADLTARHLFQERWLRQPQGRLHRPRRRRPRRGRDSRLDRRLRASRLQRSLRSHFRRRAPRLPPPCVLGSDRIRREEPHPHRAQRIEWTAPQTPRCNLTRLSSGHCTFSTAQRVPHWRLRRASPGRRSCGWSCATWGQSTIGGIRSRPYLNPVHKSRHRPCQPSTDPGTSSDGGSRLRPSPR